MSRILVRSSPKLGRKRKTLLYVLNFGRSSPKLRCKRKTLLYVLNFGTVFAQIGVKKKDPPVCPKFWYGLRPNWAKTVPKFRTYRRVFLFHPNLGEDRTKIQDLQEGLSFSPQFGRRP